MAGGMGTGSGRARSWRRPIRAALGAALLALVAGCGGDNDSPSAECRDAMQTAAAEEDMEKASPLISASLSACESADEWLAALEEYPAAMGHAEAAEVGDIDLRAACGHGRGTPVCEDAVEDGRLTRAQVQY